MTIPARVASRRLSVFFTERHHKKTVSLLQVSVQLEWYRVTLEILFSNGRGIIALN